MSFVTRQRQRKSQQPKPLQPQQVLAAFLTSLNDGKGKQFANGIALWRCRATLAEATASDELKARCRVIIAASRVGLTIDEIAQETDTSKEMVVQLLASYTSHGFDGLVHLQELPQVIADDAEADAYDAYDADNADANADADFGSGSEGAAAADADADDADADVDDGLIEPSYQSKHWKQRKNRSHDVAGKDNLLAKFWDSLLDEYGMLSANGRDLDKCRAALEDKSTSSFVRRHCRVIIAAADAYNSTNITTIFDISQAEQEPVSFVRNWIEGYIAKGFASFQSDAKIDSNDQKLASTKEQVPELKDFLDSLRDKHGELTKQGRDLKKCRAALADDSVKKSFKRRCLCVLAATRPYNTIMDIVKESELDYRWVKIWLQRYTEQGFEGLKGRFRTGPVASKLLTAFVQSLRDENGELTANGHDLEKCSQYLKSNDANEQKKKRCMCVLAAAKSGATLSGISLATGLPFDTIKQWLTRFMQNGFAGLVSFSLNSVRASDIREINDSLRTRDGIPTNINVSSDLVAFLESLHDEKGELTANGLDLDKCRDTIADDSASILMKNRCRCVLAATKKGASISYISEESDLSTQQVRLWLRRYTEQGFMGLENSPIVHKNLPPALVAFQASLRDENGELTANGLDLEKCREELNNEKCSIDFKQLCRCVVLAADGYTSVSAIAKQCDISSFQALKFLTAYTASGFAGLKALSHKQRGKGLSAFLASLYSEDGELTAQGLDLEKCRAALNDNQASKWLKNRCRCIVLAAGKKKQLFEISQECGMYPSQVRHWLKRYSEYGFAGLKTVHPSEVKPTRVLKEFLDSLRDEKGELTANGRDLTHCRAVLKDSAAYELLKKRCRCVLEAAKANDGNDGNDGKDGKSPLTIKEIASKCDMGAVAAKDTLVLFTERGLAGLKETTLAQNSPEYTAFLQSLRDENGRLTDNGRGLRKCRAAVEDDNVDEEIKQRCRIVLAAAGGSKTLSTIAKEFGVSHDRTRRWIARYTQKGFDGLTKKLPPSRKPKFATEE